MDCPAVVVSPHLDDAVFGCGEWLAAHPDAVVATVFAGVPADADRLTEWDARCGFRNAREALHTRREEDRQALLHLGARPHWLHFTDSQYGNSPSAHEIAAALGALLRELRPLRLLLPMGLFHSDHRLVFEAGMSLLQRGPAPEAYAWEDALYRRHRGALQRRLAELLRDGVLLTPARWLVPAAAEAKARAVQAYASQLRAFGPRGYEDTRHPERCWRIGLHQEECHHGS